MPEQSIMMGPGEYDPECTAVRKATEAALAIVVVVNGNRGSGFSVQTIDPTAAQKLPSMLRIMADQIEAGGCDPEQN